MKLLALLMLSLVILFAKGENADGNDMIEEKFSRMEDLLMDVISRVQIMETEKNELRSQMTDLENENLELRSKMEDVNDEVERLKDELDDVNDEVEYLKELSKLLSFRTCDEMHDFGLNKSDYYFIDPDGPLNGEEPIRVYCEFTEDYGFTKIPHDSENRIEVTHCKDPGCYSRPIVYDSSMEQIKNLIELSESCNQFIRYDCYLSPLKDDGVNLASWVDQNGQDQIYWSGSNYGNHVCSCHFSEEGCILDDVLNNTCNCDSKSPAVLFDLGYITNSSALPITELKFGGMDYEPQLGFHTLGKLSCRGKNDAMYGPIIFSTHRMINYTTTFTEGQYISGFAEFLINIGDSFTLSDGIFTAPRNGIYEFSASLYGSGHGASVLAVVRNSEQVVKLVNKFGVDDYNYYLLTFNWIMKLQRGDKIQLQVVAGRFYCDNNHANCIFNGKII